MVIDSSVPVALLLFNEGNILLSGHMSGIHTGYTSHPVSLTHSLNPLVFLGIAGCIFWGLQWVRRFCPTLDLSMRFTKSSSQSLQTDIHSNFSDFDAKWKMHLKEVLFLVTVMQFNCLGQRAGRLFWNTPICPNSNYFCLFFSFSFLRFALLM